VEVALIGLGFVSGIGLARGLGPHGRGQLAAALMWPALFTMLVTFGLPHAFAYASGAGWASPERLRRLAVRFTLCAGIPAMAFYWILCPWIFRNQFAGEIWIPRMYGLSIPLGLHAGLLLPVFQGCGDFRRWNMGRLFRGAAWALFVVSLGAFHRMSVPVLLLVQAAISLLLGYYLYQRISRLSFTEAQEKSAPFGWIFRYGRAIYISSVAYTINQQLDQLLLSLWVSPSELGQYSVSVTLAGILLPIPAAIGPILFSKMARDSNDVEKQEYHQKIALLFSISILIPAGLALALIGPWLASAIFGAEFVVAGRILRVLAPATVLLGIGNILSDVLRGAGKPMYSSYGLMAGIAFTVPGLIWALPRFGIWGAAWVSLAAYATMMVVQLYFWRQWKSEIASTAATSTTP